MMKKFSLNRNMQCLCGSGVKYKNCCANVLSSNPNPQKIDKYIQKEIKQENFAQALNFTRAQLTMYMHNIKSHTEVLLITNPPLGNALLTIDIKALDEIIERFLFIIKSGDLRVEVISNLNNLVNVFYNQKWHARITYYKVVWFYIFQDKPEEAEAILSEVSYKNIDEKDFLQLFFDIKNNELSFSNKIEIIEKIIRQVDKVSEKIQYMGAKGMEFLLIDDREQAKGIFNDAITIVEEKRKEFSDLYDFYQLANLYNFAGKLLDNKEYIEKSIACWNEVLKKEDELSLTTTGISEIYLKLGDTYTNLGDQIKAIEYYKKSFDAEPNLLSEIFIAHIYVDREDFEKASNILDRIDYDNLKEGEKVDFVFIYALLILHTKDKNKVSYILTKLKGINVPHKYYNDIKNGLIIDLQELFYFPVNEIEESKVKRILKKINDYLLLQPNFIGMGVNINKIVEDMLEKKSRS